MNAPSARAYILQQTVRSIDLRFDAATRARMLPVPKETLELAASAKPADWVPLQHLNHVYRAIVSAKNDEVGSYEDVAAAGRMVAGEATNTFMRILMKLMTPALFLRKIPEFWTRDFNTGRWEADLSQAASGVARMKLLEIGAFDHIAASASGFLETGLAAVGKPNARFTQRGWSLATPNPSEVSYEVTWT